MKSILVVLCLGFFLCVSSAFAHHSFAAEFDANSPVNITGVITKVAFANPHVYFYVDVKGADGKTENWAFEAGAPSVLFKQEWTKGTLKPGDTVSVTGFRAKSGANVAAARVVTLPDGRKVMGSAPGEGGPGSAAAPGK